MELIFINLVITLLTLHRIPPDYAVVVYSVGIAQGSEKEWNHVWEKSKTTKVASEAEIMMHALAFSQEPWLLWRYSVLLFANIRMVQWTFVVNDKGY